MTRTRGPGTPAKPKKPQHLWDKAFMEKRTRLVSKEGKRGAGATPLIWSEATDVARVIIEKNGKR